MPNAKITSKGQVTIPAEVREALGLKRGDMLAFEVQAEYVSLRRLPSAAEVAAGLDELEPISGRPGAIDDDVIAEHFVQDWDAGWGRTLYVAERRNTTR